MMSWRQERIELMVSLLLLCSASRKEADTLCHITVPYHNKAWFRSKDHHSTDMRRLMFGLYSNVEEINAMPAQRRLLLGGKPWSRTTP